MADDKTKRVPQDEQRVNIHVDYEVRYWTERFNRTREQLAAAVGRVGTVAKDVEADLKRQ